MSPVNSSLYKVVFVLGPPGCGKGTQCTNISKNFSFRHLSAGDLLREERNREGSQFGQLIQNHITNGTIVPVEITCKLIENTAVKRCLNRGQGRTDDNEESLKKRLKTYLENSYPIIQLYKERNLVRQVDGSMSQEDVYASVEKIFTEAGFSSK